MKQHRVADLEERIANAFADGAKSDIFEDLIRDVETAAKAATAASAAARTKALDPVLRAAEAASARRESDDATFRSDRLQAATVRLRDRHRAVAAKEEDARRRIEYERVSLERDKLAKELADVYPSMAASSPICCTASSPIIARSRPPSFRKAARESLKANLLREDLRGFVLGDQEVSIIEETRLPAWQRDAHRPYVYNASDTPMTLTMMRQPDVKIVKV